MGFIPKTTCRRCFREYSGLRSRCPYCGTKKVKDSTRTPASTDSTVRGTAANSRAAANAKWQMIFGAIILAVVILAVIVLISVSISGDSGGGGGSWHTVRQGETLWGIAQNYGLELTELIRLNPQIKNPNLIVVGEEVRVA